MKIKSYLPVFPGFYETKFSPDEEPLIEDGKTYDDYDWNYEEYWPQIAMQCCGTIERELSHLFDIQIEFEAVASPKYYNYANDSINCTYEVEDIQPFIKYIVDNAEEFKDYLKERYTSHSGFISHYSNKMSDWIMYLLDEEKRMHCFGAVLNFICECEGIDYHTLYDALNYHYAGIEAIPIDEEE